MANLFKKAAPVTAEAKGTKKSKKAEHHISGLQQLAELDALIKSASALKASLEAEVKEAALEIAIENAGGKKPESFRGVDGIASASLEFRKRSSASSLSQSEVDLLSEHGISAERVEVTKHLYAINPAYAADDSLLEKVSAALEGIVPDDFIMVQEGKDKYIVNDAAVDKAFAVKAPVEVIKTVITQAIKPKLEQTDLGAIIDDLRDVIAASADIADESAA